MGEEDFFEGKVIVGGRKGDLGWVGGHDGVLLMVVLMFEYLGD